MRNLEQLGFTARRLTGRINSDGARVGVGRVFHAVPSADAESLCGIILDRDYAWGEVGAAVTCKACLRQLRRQFGHEEP